VVVLLGARHLGKSTLRRLQEHLAWAKANPAA
jgi:hypothetical protein